MNDAIYTEQRKQWDRVDWIWHTWINERQEQRRKDGQETEHDLYEWKRALVEMMRMPIWLKRARTGDLPTEHQQCSHSETEPISENRLICALGVNVLECPILTSLRARFDTVRAEREFYRNVTDGDVDQVAAWTCAWHIFTEHQKNPGIDTSEGYVQDESDRRFWKRVYDNLTAEDEYSEDDVPAYLGPGHFLLPGEAE